MMGLCFVFLNFKKAHGIGVQEWILLPVQSAGLERHIHFAHIHHRGIGSQGL